MFEAYFSINIKEIYLHNQILLHKEVMKRMKLITLYLPEPYIEALDKLVSEKYYPHRAEAIRVAVRDLINMELRGRRGNGKASR